MRVPVSVPDDRFLLVDAAGVVRGLAIRDRRDRRRAIGWTQGRGHGPPRVAALIQ